MSATSCFKGVEERHSYALIVPALNILAIPPGASQMVRVPRLSVCFKLFWQ